MISTLQLTLAKLSLLLISISFAATATTTYPVVGIPTPDAPKIDFATSTLLKSPAWVQAYVEDQAMAVGLNPALISCIVSHESSFGVHMVGNEPNGTTSYGYWQFNDGNSDFDYVCSMNLECSTKTALKLISKGKIRMWSTYHDFCTAYPIN